MLHSQAMEELKEAVMECTEGNFTPKIVKVTDDYLYAEFESPTFGFQDDVEFWFNGNKSQVQNIYIRGARNIEG
jgi:uncharacterized protein (DUF1499 family)